MKKFLVFVFLILFVTIQCNDDGGYQESLDNMSKMGILGIIQYSLQPPPKFCRYLSSQTEDNNNGTLSLILTGNGMNFSGTCANYYLYKKCLQGQVYRKAENDCKGKGNESDYYGARLFTGVPSATESWTCDDIEEFGHDNWYIASFGSSLDNPLIDLLMKEHSFLENQCLWYKAYWNGTVQCTLLPDNKLVNVNKDKYRLYALCYAPIKNEYRDSEGNPL